MIIATLNLENLDDLQLTNAKWRYADWLVPGEPNGGLVDQLPESPARLADYDDSGWAVCENIQKGVSRGLCFGWYRITVTLPERIDDVELVARVGDGAEPRDLHWHRGACGLDAFVVVVGDVAHATESASADDEIAHVERAVLHEDVGDGASTLHDL